jgi:hypothetical protein
MTDDWARAVALASASYITLGYLACFSVLLYLDYRQCAAHPPHDHSAPVATSATQGQRIGETRFFRAPGWQEADMANLLFIESRDPYDAGDTQHFHELIKGVRQRNNTVTLFLIQNGVLSTRPGAKFSERYGELTRSGITVLADEFSLRERAIERLVEGVQKADVNQLVDLLFEADTKAIWH